MASRTASYEPHISWRQRKAVEYSKAHPVPKRSEGPVKTTVGSAYRFYQGFARGGTLSRPDLGSYTIMKTVFRVYSIGFRI